MRFEVRLGVPDMSELWDGLEARARAGTISPEGAELRAKWGKAMRLLAANPRHPGLRTHDIEPLTKRYGMRVWQSYIENGRQARRMFWVYGPGPRTITVIGLEPHPEDGKRGGYDKVGLCKP